jgi:hypothetical protein
MATQPVKWWAQDLNQGLSVYIAMLCHIGEGRKWELEIGGSYFYVL